MSSTSLEPPVGTGPTTLDAARAAFAALRSRARTGIWVETFGVLGGLLVAYAIPTLLTDRGLRLEWVFRCILLVSFLAVVARTVFRRLLVPLAVPLDDQEIALAVERQAPDVKQALISSLQFETALHAGRSNDSPALMAAVIEDVRTRLGGIPFDRAIDRRRVRRFGLLLAVTAAFFGGWAALDASSFGIWARRNLLLTNVDWPRYTTLTFVDGEAGVRLPQGDALTVRVAVQGPVPEQIFLATSRQGADAARDAMRRTGDAEFTTTIDAVLDDLLLRAEGGDALPVELRVTVVARPRLEDVELRITYPDYMEREPELVPATEGELKLPKGARVGVRGRSHKPIDEAFVLFDGERKLALTCAADGVTFAGEFAPDAGGLLVLDVVDRDRLGAGSPPKWLLRLGDDKPPSLDLRLRGIGSLISSHARIPGDLKVKDDFGLRAIDVAMRVVEEVTVDAKPGPTGDQPSEVPFENAMASYQEPLPKSALRYESPVAVDLLQWNPEPDQSAVRNRIRPGMLLSLRFGATDNFGPGEPHHGYGETLTFRVVTREKLLEDLRRRQVEQRQELERVIADEQTSLGELKEIPAAATVGEKGALVRTRLKAMARQQQALGRRTAFVGETYQRLLWEYENNRLIEANQVRNMESLIPVPLAALAKEAFPASARLVEAFATAGEEAGRGPAINTYEDILKRLLTVLKEMEQAENLAALLEELRVVIKMEDAVLQEVENRKQAEEQSTFGPGKEPPKKR